MSDRPTPETNAFGGNQEAWIKFAEKLERERDEAIAARKASASDWLSQVEQANSRTSRALQRVALAERERDEAREELKQLKEKYGR